MFAFIGYMLSFNINLTEIIVTGDGNAGYKVSKFKANKAKWNKQRTALIFLYPMFRNKKHVPVNTDQIYDNKLMYFNFNGLCMPANIKLTDVGGRPLIIPELKQLEEFQINMRKENAREFAEHDFWSENKSLIVALVTCIFCLAAVGFTVYMTYNFATGGVNAMNNLADKIGQLGVVQSVSG